MADGAESKGTGSHVAGSPSLPLSGKTIVVTRARAQSGGMTSALEALGAEVLEAPSIEIVPPESYAPLDEAIRNLESYDWVALTSANGVQHFLERLSACGRDVRALAGARIAAVGSATAQALRDVQLQPDAMPPQFNAESLSEVLAATGVAGRRFLLVRAQEGSEVLPVALRALGATVEVAPAYRTVRAAVDLEPLRRRLQSGTVAAVAFASPSAVRSLTEQFEPGELRTLLARTRVAVIGPVTAAAISELGIEVAIQPEEATVPALVAALERELAPGRSGGPR